MWNFSHKKKLIHLFDEFKSTITVSSNPEMIFFGFVIIKKYYFCSFWDAWNNLICTVELQLSDTLLGRPGQGIRRLSVNGKHHYAMGPPSHGRLMDPRIPLTATIKEGNAEPLRANPWEFETQLTVGRSGAVYPSRCDLTALIYRPLALIATGGSISGHRPLLHVQRFLLFPLDPSPFCSLPNPIEERERGRDH